MKASSKIDRMEVGGPFWKSCVNRSKFVILGKVGGSTWRCVEARGLLPPNTVVEAAIDGSYGSVLLHRQ